jgi:alpha-galactosidase
MYRRREKTWKAEAKKWLRKDSPISLERQQEYAAPIINAYTGGEIYEFNGNVRNTNLVTNLPLDACVEVPVLASRGSLSPIYVGALPPQCAILTGVSAQTEMMAVEGSLSGDPTLIYQAIAHDPLTAAKLSLAEIKKMTLEMLKRNKRYLPQFKKIDF